MVMLKPSFLLVSALLALGAVMPVVQAGSVIVEFDTKDPVAKRPKYAKVACVATSRTCKSDKDYLNAHWGPMVHLDTCHHESKTKNFYNQWLRLGKHRGQFVNTFYVTVCTYHAQTKTKNCNFMDVNPLSVQAVVERHLKKTDCDAEIKCYRIDQIDDKCFPKDNDHHDK